VDPLSFFFISFFFSDKNMNAKKSLDQFDFWKVLETSKYTKQVFPIM
jgi:hypothetical protein